MKHFFICVFSFLIGLSASSQYLGFEFNPEIPVLSASAQTLNHAWDGGLNFVQVSDIDYDFDGDKDLVFFDRSGEEIMLYANNTGSYEFVQRGYLLFPADVRYRMALLDYNGDGKNDIFTYGVGGVKVYRNTGNSTTGLQWQLASPLLMSDYVGNYSNLYVSSGDIPAFVDVEGDGDIDVLTFNVGGQQLEYHQNQSMDLYGHADSLIFILKNECWGQFQEDLNNNSVVLNSNIFPCGSGNIPNPQRPADPENKIEEVTRHSGSTVLALDMNGNGVLDLILGDVSYSGLDLLMNGGSAPNTNSPMISQDVSFPSNSVAVNLQLFPAAFFVDVDFDGKRDLIASPNAKTISQNQKSVAYYHNSGADNSPVFTFQSKAFMQSDMIDAGLGSIPVLVDANGDGLTDLLISSFFRYKDPLDKECAFNLYLNTGSASNPQFTDTDPNFLNMPTAIPSLRLFPAFSDTDSDGDQDLYIGKEDGTISYLQNTAGPGQPITFAGPVSLSDQSAITIDVGYYAAPTLFDLDRDGLTDLIVGRQSGELIFYKNTGTASSPQFTLFNDHLGNIDLSVGSPDGYTAPTFLNYNDTTLLFLGGYDGKIHYYNGIDGHLAPDSSFHLVSAHFLDHDFGLYSNFAIKDVDGDGFLNMFAGHDLGGVQLFEVNPNSTLAKQEIPTSKNWIIYPNPADQVTHLSGHGNAQWQLLTSEGKLLTSGLVLDEGPISLEELSAGIYLIRIVESDHSEVHRLIVH